MKRLQFAAGVLLTLAFSRLHAQTLQAQTMQAQTMQAQTMDLRATIPFEFRLGETLMPAGDYLVNHSNGVLKLRPQYGKPAVILTFATKLPQDSKTAGLLFYRYGETYFFGQVWTSGSATARGIQQSSLEKELAIRGGPGENSNIILQTK